MYIIFQADSFNGNAPLWSNSYDQGFTLSLASIRRVKVSMSKRSKSRAASLPVKEISLKLGKDELLRRLKVCSEKQIFRGVYWCI